jgi:hypothetical protein
VIHIVCRRFFCLLPSGFNPPLVSIFGLANHNREPGCIGWLKKQASFFFQQAVDGTAIIR